MSSEDSKAGGEPIAQAARRKSRRALRTARLNLEDGDADGAVSRAYYAAYRQLKLTAVEGELTFVSKIVT